MKLRKALIAAAAVPMLGFLGGGMAHASSPGPLTSQQVATEGQAARADLISHGYRGHALGGVWQCTAETWWYTNYSGKYIQPKTGGLEGGDDSSVDDTYQLCGWSDNSANQFALYDDNAAKYVGINESGNAPLEAYLAGGNSLAFFHLDSQHPGTGTGCTMQWYNYSDVNPSVNWGVTGSSPGYELLATSGGNYQFLFGAFPGTGQGC